MKGLDAHFETLLNQHQRKIDAMKTYEIELKRVSYVTITVEAENAEAAEEAAWLELQTGDFDDSDAEWTLSNVEEA